MYIVIILFIRCCMAQEKAECYWLFNPEIQMRCLRVGCGLDMVGKCWKKGLCLGQSCFDIRCSVLICPAEDMHCLVPEIQRCQLHSSEACQVLQQYDLF